MRLHPEGFFGAGQKKQEMAARGVSMASMSTISYGEERPFAFGNDESAWMLNRRAHFVIVAR